MPPPTPNRRSSVAVGIEWATRITSLALELVIPTLLGMWGDQKWDTAPWLLLLGAGLGMASAGLHFRQLAGDLSGRSRQSRTKK